MTDMARSMDILSISVFFLFGYPAYTLAISLSNCSQIIQETVDINKVLFTISTNYGQSTSSVINPKFERCFYAFQFIKLTAIRLSLQRVGKYVSSPYGCAFQFELLTGIEDVPVKKISPCTDKTDWMIPWPWNRGILKVKILDDRSIHAFKENKSEPLTLSIRPKKRKLPILNNAGKKIVHFDEDTIGLPSKHEYNLCLDNTEHYFKLRYSSGYKLYNRAFGHNHKNVVFGIKEKVQICLKTEIFYSQRICPWEVHIKTNSNILMKLGCFNIEKFWCLPWKRIRNDLKIEWIGEPKGYAYYSVDIVTNTSSATETPCLLEQNTTPRNSDEYETLNVPESENVPGYIYGPLLGIVFSCMFPVGVLFLRTFVLKKEITARLNLRRSEGSIQGRSRFVVSSDGTTFDTWNPSGAANINLDSDSESESFITLNLIESRTALEHLQSEDPYSNRPNVEPALPSNVEYTPLPTPPTYEEALNMSTCPQ